MNLFTSVELPRQLLRFSQAEQLLLMGSCFATEMGERLLRAKFRCCLHPYGVLYNPLSIGKALDELLDGKCYAPSDLFFHDELWHSHMHHGSFSATTADAACARIHEAMNAARTALEQLDVLILTWGTAYVYEHPEVGVVGNCHKLPEKLFRRRRLTVDEIVDATEAVFRKLFAFRPSAKIILTVSPIRHVRDGLHQNQLSKSTLLLAIERLAQTFPNRINYFPAYEIVVDELRDYRFYADDLVHPSPTAIEYIWECFVKTCFKPEAVEIVQKTLEIDKALNHKPLHPDSESYKIFLEQIILKIDQLNGKFPYLELSNERRICQRLLSKYQK